MLNNHTDLVGKTVSALGAATLQDITSSFAGHTLEESVLARAMTLFGLIGALWHWYSLYAQMPCGK